MPPLINNNIKITVIIPVFNAEKHIHKCINSIFQQNIDSIEIIAINDGSSDNSLEILNRNNERHPELIIINHPANRGAGAARNNAIKEARGKYIAYIDSDDWIGEKYLERLYHEAEKTGADIVFSNLMMVNNNVEQQFIPFQAVINKYHNTNIPLTDLPNDCRTTAPWMKLFRKDFITKNNLQFLEGIKLGAEDIPFSWTAYCIASNISFCQDVYYYYNSIQDSLDRAVNENIIEIFDSLDFAKKEYQRFDPHHIHYAQLDTLYVSHVYYQFSKITNNYIDENINIASLYWEKSHNFLTTVIPDNIINNMFLNRYERIFYFDNIMNPNFSLEMKKKYCSKNRY